MEKTPMTVVSLIGIFLLFMFFTSFGLGEESSLNQTARPVHDLSKHFVIKPTFNISSISYIKPMHSVTFNPKPLQDISNATPVYPLVQAKRFPPVHLLDLSMQPKVPINLMKGIPGYMSF